MENNSEVEKGTLLKNNKIEQEAKEQVLTKKKNKFLKASLNLNREKGKDGEIIDIIEDITSSLQPLKIKNTDILKAMVIYLKEDEKFREFLKISSITYSDMTTYRFFGYNIKRLENGESKIDKDYFLAEVLPRLGKKELNELMELGFKGSQEKKLIQ